jgi:hypothetical protein
LRDKSLRCSHTFSRSDSGFNPTSNASRVGVQTLETYEREVRLFLTRWGKLRYKRPALLVAFLTLLPTRAVLLDLGRGGGQDSRYLNAVAIVSLDWIAHCPCFGSGRNTLLSCRSSSLMCDRSLLGPSSWTSSGLQRR